MKPELLIQTRLRLGDSVETICKEHGLVTRTHGEFPELTLFVYDQIESRPSDPLARQCRGLILNSADNWNIVSYSMNRFANSGEGWAAPIDWTSCQIQEKLDGSLAVLYHYANRWHWQTKGSPDASGPCGAIGNKTFAESFSLIWAVTGDWHYPTDTDIVVFFEYCSRENKVVVPHDRASLTVLGARNRKTLREYSAEEAVRMVADWRGTHVRSFPLTSLEEVLAASKALNPLKQEGFVVVDKDFNRIKVKSPAYVALHHMKSSFSLRAAVEIVRSGESEEVGASFPEWADLLGELKARLEKLVSETERIYEIHKHKVSQKEFALAVKSFDGAGAMFMIRAGKVANVREWFGKLPVDSACRLLKTEDFKTAPVAAVE